MDLKKLTIKNIFTKILFNPKNYPMATLKNLRAAAQKTKDGKVDLRTKEGKEVAAKREERNEKRAARKAAKK
jgi:hypothetical protein